MRRDDGGEFWDTVFDVASLVLSVVDVVANPEDPLAWIGLVGDAIDLVPFVTGVGETVRVVSTVIDIADAVHDVDNGVEVVESSTKIFKYIDDDIAKYADDIIESSKTTKIHGNSLDSPAKNYGYALRDNDTNEILKYGESIKGTKRYTNKFYEDNNCYMDIITSGSKREIHQWQHEQIVNYVSKHGKKPPLNKSLW